MTENVYGRTITETDAQRETWSVNNLIELDRDDLVADLVDDRHTPVPTSTAAAAVASPTSAAVRRGTRAAHRVAHRAALRRRAR